MGLLLAISGGGDSMLVFDPREDAEPFFFFLEPFLGLSPPKPQKQAGNSCLLCYCVCSDSKVQKFKVHYSHNSHTKRCACTVKDT